MRLAFAVSMIALLALPADALADPAKPREACRADVKRLCDGVKPGGGRIKECFKTHREEISADCRAALKGARERRQSMKAK